MQATLATVVVLCLSSMLLLSHITSSHAMPALRQKRGADTEVTLALLEELVDELRSENVIQKRRIDAGYGSRYAAGASVGSKLRALKQAADWNGPGRKRRNAEEFDEE